MNFYLEGIEPLTFELLIESANTESAKMFMSLLILFIAHLASAPKRKLSL